MDDLEDPSEDTVVQVCNVFMAGAHVGPFSAYGVNLVCVQCERLISQSSKALKSCDSTQQQSNFLCKRSSAFARCDFPREVLQALSDTSSLPVWSQYHIVVKCRLSKYLRAIPAAQSERQALSGLDPFHLAHLALNDATKAAELTRSAKAYELQVIGVDTVVGQSHATDTLLSLPVF